MEKIIFATHNKNKAFEIKNMLDNIEIVCLTDIGDLDDVEETGNTFKENAFIKANYYYRKYHLPVIADDTGLVCLGLNGDPGVYSARYSGANATYDSNNKKLLKELENNPNRNAYFICVICYIDKDGNVKYFEGKINGEIAEKTYGNNGFGYDPVFYVTEIRKTFSELSISEKNKISHRAKAFIAFKEYVLNGK